MTDNELRRLFRALRESVPNTANEDVEQRLRTAFRVEKSRRNRWRDIVFKVAASVALVLGLYFLLWHGRATNGESAADRAIYKDSGFVLLPYGQSDVPIEQPVIVRIQVPASKLSGLGISIPSLPGGGSRVEADLLIGQDGVARAVRVNRQIKP